MWRTLDRSRSRIRFSVADFVRSFSKWNTFIYPTHLFFWKISYTDAFRYPTYPCQTLPLQFEELIGTFDNFGQRRDSINSTCKYDQKSKELKFVLWRKRDLRRDILQSARCIVQGIDDNVYCDESKQISCPTLSLTSSNKAGFLTTATGFDPEAYERPYQTVKSFIVANGTMTTELQSLLENVLDQQMFVERVLCCWCCRLDPRRRRAGGLRFLSVVIVT